MSNQQAFLAATGSAFFVWGMLGVVLGPLLPEIQATYELSSTAAGFVFFLWSVGFSVGSFASRGALDRWTPIALLAALSGGASIAALALYAAPGYLSFTAAFLAVGLAGGATFTAGHTLISRAFANHRVAALSALDIVFSAGNVAAPIAVIALLSAGHAWKLPFLVLAGLFLMNAAICALVLLLAQPSASRTVDGAGMQNEDRPPRHVGLLLLAVASFALGWLEQGQHVWLVTYGIEAGQDERTARLGHVAFLVGMIAVRFLAVGLNRRMQDSGVLRLLFATAAMGFLILVMGGTEIAYLTGSAMLGIGIGALFPIFLGRATDVAPSETATFSMVMIVSVAVGGQLASLGIGALSDLFGVTSAFLANGAMLALLIAVAERFHNSTGATLEASERSQEMSDTSSLEPIR